ncbi:MAG: DUF448 domain-containing protein [Polyangiaceae bacterium]|nr:DUF448 domain-containing protein [Polyangiaceae bacterium]
MLESSVVEVAITDSPRPPGTQRPGRSCIGCGQPGSRSDLDLVRFVLGEAGTVHIDLRGRAFGRGAWVHPTPACITRAAKVGLSRSFRTNVSATAPELIAALHAAMHQRVEGLLKAGVRSRKIVVGSTAVAEAFGHGKVKAIVVGSDARAAASSREVAETIAAGRAMVWGTKDQLGKIAGRTEVGVIAVVDRELALGLLRCSAVLQMPESMVPEKTPKRMNRVDE